MTPTELNLKAKALLETHFDDIVLSGKFQKLLCMVQGIGILI